MTGTSFDAFPEEIKTQIVHHLELDTTDHTHDYNRVDLISLSQVSRSWQGVAERVIWRSVTLDCTAGNPRQSSIQGLDEEALSELFIHTCDGETERETLLPKWGEVVGCHRLLTAFRRRPERAALVTRLRVEVRHSEYEGFSNFPLLKAIVDRLHAQLVALTIPNPLDPSLVIDSGLKYSQLRYLSVQLGDEWETDILNWLRLTPSLVELTYNYATRPSPRQFDANALPLLPRIEVLRVQPAWPATLGLAVSLILNSSNLTELSIELSNVGYRNDFEPLCKGILEHKTLRILEIRFGGSTRSDAPMGFFETLHSGGTPTGFLKTLHSGESARSKIEELRMDHSEEPGILAFPDLQHITLSRRSPTSWSYVFRRLNGDRAIDPYFADAISRAPSLVRFIDISPIGDPLHHGTAWLPHQCRAYIIRTYTDGIDTLLHVKTWVYQTSDIPPYDYQESTSAFFRHVQPQEIPSEKVDDAVRLGGNAVPMGLVKEAYRVDGLDVRWTKGERDVQLSDRAWAILRSEGSPTRSCSVKQGT